MNVINAYATLDDYKGIKDIDTLDGADDIVIEQLLESASHFIDENTGRTFYPRVETRYYSIPESGMDYDELWLDDDLLEVITLTNGNSVAISASDYYLKPRNTSPRYALHLKDSSSVTWETDSNGNSEYVIALNGIWGYHDQYSQRAWKQATQLNGALTASTTPITVDTGTNVAQGQIYKIDNELMICGSNTSTTITPIQRGENGSTATTHLDDAPVYIWNPIVSIQLACLEIVKGIYSRRFGVNTTGAAVITAAGVVITPEDVPSMAWKIINTYKRIV